MSCRGRNREAPLLSLPLTRNGPVLADQPLASPPSDGKGVESIVKLAPIFKVSLRTKDVEEARLRHASVQAQLQERWILGYVAR